MQLIWERKYGLCKRKYSLVANNSEKLHNFGNGQSAVFKSSGIMTFKPMLHNLMKMKVKYVTHALDFYFKRKMDWAAFSSLHWHFLLNLHKLLWQLHDRYQDASTTWPAQPRAGHTTILEMTPTNKSRDAPASCLWPILVATLLSLHMLEACLHLLPLNANVTLGYQPQEL